MSVKFHKTHIKLVYQYILLHDGQTLLQKNISRDTGVGIHTVGRDLKYLLKRRLIKRDGKDYFASSLADVD